jgi:hypothetical protein
MEESHNGFMTQHIRYFGLHITYKACVSLAGLCTEAPVASRQSYWWKLRGENAQANNDNEKSNLAPRPKPMHFITVGTSRFATSFFNSLPAPPLIRYAKQLCTFTRRGLSAAAERAAK